MAKKAQATKKTAEQAVSISRLKINQLFFESWLIIQGFLGIYALVSLVTFSPNDPGWNSQNFLDERVIQQIEISNAVGSWGAFLSDLLFSLVGYMAFLIPYWLLWPLIRHFIFFRRPIQFSQIYSGLIGIRIIGWSLFLICSCSLINLFVNVDQSLLPENSGGLIGSTISSFTLVPLSLVGSTLLFTCFALLGLTLSLEISWTALIIRAQEFFVSFGGDFGQKISDFLANVREKQRLRKEKIERQHKVLEEVKKKEKIKVAEVVKPNNKTETRLRKLFLKKS